MAPPLPEVPERLRALTAHETRLIASLRGAALDDAGVLELTGWAHPRLVDLAGQDVQVRAVLVQDGSGRRHELPVELREDPEADLFGAHAYQSYAPSGFVTRVDLHEILALTFADEPDQGGPGRLGTWRLELTSAVAGVVRTGALRSRDTRSSAAELPSVRAEDGLAVVPVLDGAEGLRLEVRRPRALLVSLDVSGRAVSGTLRMTGRAGAESRLLDRARGPLQLRFRAAGASTVTADLRANDGRHPGLRGAAAGPGRPRLGRRPARAPALDRGPGPGAPLRAPRLARGRPARVVAGHGRRRADGPAHRAGQRPAARDGALRGGRGRRPRRRRGRPRGPVAATRRRRVAAAAGAGRRG